MNRPPFRTGKRATRWLCAGLFFASLLFSNTASSQQKNDSVAEPALGVALPLSGKYGAIGKQLLETAELAASETGIRIVSQDTEGEPEGGVKAVSALAADPSVVAILGPLGHRESAAAAAVAQRLNVPVFLLAGVADLEKIGPWVFRLRQSPGEQASQMARRARKSLGLTKVGILFPENTYGTEAAESFAETFRRLGGSVTAVSAYAEDTTDFRESLDVLTGKKVQLGKDVRVDGRGTDGRGYLRIRRESVVDFDGLFIPDSHHRVARLLPFLPGAGLQNGAGGQGVSVQILGTAAWQGKTMEMTGSRAAGALYLDTFAGESAGGREAEFSRLHEEKLGRRATDVDAETFDAAWLLGNLIRKAVDRLADDASPARARRLLPALLPRKDEWTGVAGRIRFGKSGAPIRELELYRFDVDGQVVPMQ